MINQPIFLVGAERSGTTLLRLMLNNHPDIVWMPEFEYAVDLVNNQGHYPSLNYFYEYLETDRNFQANNLYIDKKLTYSQLVNDFMQQTLSASQKSLIGATVHRNFDRLLYIWPDARFVHIIRDPRDVARSNIGMGWAGNVFYGVDRWIEAETLWEQIKTKILPEKYIEILYENLICEPEQKLTDICHFLNITYDKLMLDYDENTTYSKPDSNLIEQWRTKLSDLEIQLVETKVSDLLITKGYLPSNLPKIKISNFHKNKLSLQNWWYKVNYRINTFGLLLFLAEYLSRKLRLKSWHDNYLFKMNQINNKNLK